MQDYKSTVIFIAKIFNLISNSKITNLLSIKNYQLAFEIFIYVMSQTCLDLTYSISTFSKFSANFSKKYIDVVKQVY